MSEPFHAFRLAGRGAGRVLGELESRILEVLWQRECASVRDVCDALGAGLSFNTVMTVMNRLVDKGLLRRTGQRRSYEYRPALGREEFFQRLSREVSRGLVEEFRDQAVAQFVDVLETVDPELIRQLEKLLEERRRTP